jgi:hypothetical protein
MYEFVHVESPLWREVGSVVSCCCRASPAQSFPGLSSLDSWPYYTFSSLGLSPLGAPGFSISPRYRVAQLYPQLLYWVSCTWVVKRKSVPHRKHITCSLQCPAA